MRHGRIVGRFRGKHFGHVVRVELAALRQADVRFRLTQAGLGLLLGGQRRLQSKLRVAILELGQDLPLLDESARIHRSLNHSPRGGRRHIRRFLGEKASRHLHRRRNLPRYGAHGSHFQHLGRSGGGFRQGDVLICVAASGGGE